MSDEYFECFEFTCDCIGRQDCANRRKRSFTTFCIAEIYKWLTFCSAPKRFLIASRHLQHSKFICIFRVDEINEISLDALFTIAAHQNPLRIRVKMSRHRRREKPESKIPAYFAISQKWKLNGPNRDHVEVQLAFIFRMKSSFVFAFRSPYDTKNRKRFSSVSFYINFQLIIAFFHSYIAARLSPSHRRTNGNEATSEKWKHKKCWTNKLPEKQFFNWRRRKKMCFFSVAENAGQTINATTVFSARVKRMMGKRKDEKRRKENIVETSCERKTKRIDEFCTRNWINHIKMFMFFSRFHCSLLTTDIEGVHCSTSISVTGFVIRIFRQSRHKARKTNRMENAMKIFDMWKWLIHCHSKVLCALGNDESKCDIVDDVEGDDDNSVETYHEICRPNDIRQKRLSVNFVWKFQFHRNNNWRRLRITWCYNDFMSS